jgi:hypothetical protein
LGFQLLEEQITGLDNKLNNIKEIQNLG